MQRLVRCSPSGFDEGDRQYSGNIPIKLTLYIVATIAVSSSASEHDRAGIAFDTLGGPPGLFLVPTEQYKQRDGQGSDDSPFGEQPTGLD